MRQIRSFRKPAIMIYAISKLGALAVKGAYGMLLPNGLERDYGTLLSSGISEGSVDINPRCMAHHLCSRP